MNYQKIYAQLIDRAINESRLKNNGVYYERHHIIPKCIGGTNKNDNLVLLTPKEHFIAHKLLHKIYPDNQKLHYALWAMINGITKRNGLKISANDYHEIKQLHGDAVRRTHNNKIVSQETRNKQSNFRLNSERKQCKYCNVVSDIGNISRWHNDHCKYNPNRILTANTLHTCSYCNIQTTKTNILRWHNNNCKNKE